MPRPPSENSAAAVDRLRDELHCLQCHYSLRGLSGEVVTCPECGLDHDVAQIIARRWDQPWYRAPGFNRLVFPLAWATIATILLFPFAIITDHLLETYPMLSLVAGALIVFVWIWMLRRTRTVVSIASGPWLAMLAHAIFIGYLAGVGAILKGLAAAIGQMPAGRLIDFLIGGMLVAIGCALFWMGRRGEKYIAAICIRQHLLGHD